MYKPYLLYQLDVLWIHIVSVQSNRYTALVSLSSDNGLLPDGTKPLPEPMLTSQIEVQWAVALTQAWVTLNVSTLAKC